jgi:hypothetical protein
MSGDSWEEQGPLPVPRDWPKDKLYFSAMPISIGGIVWKWFGGDKGWRAVESGATHVELQTIYG